jgi:hypothetical protein
MMARMCRDIGQTAQTRNALARFVTACTDLELEVQLGRDISSSPGAPGLAGCQWLRPTADGAERPGPANTAQVGQSH